MSLKKFLLVSVGLAFGVGIAFSLVNTNNYKAGADFEPTTATLKPVEDGHYLRLEQVHSQVVARFLFSCIEERMYWNAGIVTTPELSASKLAEATNNYLEIDSAKILPALRKDGAEVSESTIWIFRPLDPQQIAAIKRAKTLGAWIENGSDFRWGAFMYIDNVRNELNEYIEKCVN